MAEERGKTVLVLGAGATRACSFVDPSNWPCLPPLDRDFFTQLQRVPDEKHQEAIAEVIKDVTNMFGTNFDVTLENVFSTVEHTIRMLSVTRSSRAYNRRDLEGMRDRLLAAIAIVMEAALAERADNGRARHAGHPCDYHTQLVRDVLEPGDHIISFNYDCVIDSALKECGSKKWNARYGYGFDLGPRGANLEGDEAWQPETPATKGSTIHLHKVHGSLHFQFADGDKGVGKRQKIKLKKRPYTKQKGTPRYSIIPPESNKPYDKGIFARLWSNAAKALGQARHLIIIGYSLPATDLHATALFRTSIKGGSMKSLVIVNPSAPDRTRIRSVLQRALSSTTRVLSCDSLPEFLATDKRVWRGRERKDGD